MSESAQFVTWTSAVRASLASSGIEVSDLHVRRLVKTLMRLEPAGVDVTRAAEESGDADTSSTDFSRALIALSGVQR